MNARSASPGRARVAWLAAATMILSSMGALPGCQGDDAHPDPQVIDEDGVAVGEYMLRLSAPSQMGLLRGALSRRGIAIRHEYSDLVGLSGTVSVAASAAQVSALLHEMPMPIEAHAVVLRYPLSPCGDGICDPMAEAENDARSTICSYDCGVPLPRAQRDELLNSWAARLVGADKIWGTTRGEGIHVAVLDTGWDRGPASVHPDRPENFGWSYNFATSSPDYSGVGEHGTHVMGIIAAPKNGFGMIGVAPAATVHAFQVFSRTGVRIVARDADIIAAIEAAIRNGYHIINMSLGGGHDSELEHQAIRRAYDAGLLVVVAAGNGEDYDQGSVATAPRHFPGAYPESMSVGATTRHETIAGFSATGHTVTVSAPGAAVYSTVPVGTGEGDTRVVFTTRSGMKALQATLQTGASATAIEGAEVVWCGFGSLAEVARCRPAGKVALVQRGPAAPGQTPITFADKIVNTRSQGAIGVVLYNHRYGDPEVAGALFGANIGTAQPVPVLALAAGDGERLAEMIAMEPVRIAVSTTFSDYDSYSGTSMAAPVVSGVAALLWSRHRHLSNVELRQLLSESAVDLGAPGRDDAFGWGRVDAVRAFAQAAPRARCGDGKLDRASEICDGALTSGGSCEELGWDDVPEGRLMCNRRCTSVDTQGCRCLPGREPFAVTLHVTENHREGGQTGTLAVYNVKLRGKPVPGAMASVTVRKAGMFVFDYGLGPSDREGNIRDFTAYEKTMMSPGVYEFSPIISKGGGRCRDDQPSSPPSYTVNVRS